MKKNVLIYLALTILISCKSNDIIDKNWELIKLTDIEETVVDSFSIRAVNFLPYDIILRDSSLIIRNLKSDTVFRVYSLPEFKYNGWFGKLGKGPNEFLLAPLIREYNGLIQLSGVRKIIHIDLPHDNINNEFKIINEFYIPGKLHPLNETFSLNDNKYYGITFTGRKSDLEKRKELVYFDTKTNDVGSVIDYPNSLFRGLPNYSFLYPKCITVSPENDKFAFCYMLYPLIRIFNKKLEVTKEIWIENLPKQIVFKNVLSTVSSGKKSNLPLGRGYYIKAVSSSKLIYALYQNDKGIEKDKNKFSYERSLISNPELHVFTWQGAPVYRISLRKATSAIELSADERYLYTVEADKEDKIYRYDLSKF